MKGSVILINFKRHWFDWRKGDFSLPDVISEGHQWNTSAAVKNLCKRKRGLSFSIWDHYFWIYNLDINIKGYLPLSYFKDLGMCYTYVTKGKYFTLVVFYWPGWFLSVIDFQLFTFQVNIKMTTNYVNIKKWLLKGSSCLWKDMLLGKATEVSAATGSSKLP